MILDVLRGRGPDFSVEVLHNNTWPVDLAKKIGEMQVGHILCINECINSPQCGMVVANLTLLMQDKYHEQPVRFDLLVSKQTLVVHCVPK